MHDFSVPSQCESTKQVLEYPIVRACLAPVHSQDLRPHTYFNHESLDVFRLCHEDDRLGVDLERV